MKLDDIIEHNIKNFLGCKLSPNFYTILNFIVITPLIVNAFLNITNDVLVSYDNFGVTRWGICRMV